MLGRSVMLILQKCNDLTDAAKQTAFRKKELLCYFVAEWSTNVSSVYMVTLLDSTL